MNITHNPILETLRKATYSVEQCACLAALLAAVPNPCDAQSPGQTLADWHVIQANLELLMEKAYSAVESLGVLADSLESINHV